MEDRPAMWNSEEQTTAAGNALRPAAVGHGPGFPEASETGNIPEIIGNDCGLYEGDLTGYFRALIFHATNLTRPYHNLRHMLHVTWLCYQAAEFYRDRLTQRQIRNLLIAALFHDFDHPGHPHPGADDPDGINIGRSIAALRRHIAPEDRPAGHRSADRSDALSLRRRRRAARPFGSNHSRCRPSAIAEPGLDPAGGNWAGAGAARKSARD